MSTVPRYAIIPTHNRPDDLTNLVTSLDRQCDLIVVIDNASPHPVDNAELLLQMSHASIVVIRDNEQPPNLSRLWNVGLDIVTQMCETFHTEKWDVAIFNDDTVLPSDWYDTVAHGLRRGSADPIVCCGAVIPGAVREPILKREPDRDPMTRMCPWAFVTRGEAGLRSDETMRWWWSDTDWDFRARQAGGVLILPDLVAINSKANSTTFGALAEQAGRDRETFRQKWGQNPW